MNIDDILAAFEKVSKPNYGLRRMVVRRKEVPGHPGIAGLIKKHKRTAPANQGGIAQIGSVERSYAEKRARDNDLKARGFKLDTPKMPKVPARKPLSAPAIVEK